MSLEQMMPAQAQAHRVGRRVLRTRLKALEEAVAVRKGSEEDRFPAQR
ncbi:hypothetical protein [Nonomuraea jabiensis]|uniref:Uncharacterized protein n=1 Tax=Nonomuraea jabiensis TaxID=882448 RepID=A0A7W9G0H3_9ACTN|nr:hypothetical protein [Nonomuraea jabiensis]MBB5774930.1 hypothetical protein [Nonomuraea jabiensis]